MKTWARATQAITCGRDPSHMIELGDPIQVITIHQLARRLIRCVQCAEGTPPPDLPALVERQIEPSTPLRMRPLRDALPQDFKLAQSKD